MNPCEFGHEILSLGHRPHECLKFLARETTESPHDIQFSNIFKYLLDLTYSNRKSKKSH